MYPGKSQSFVAENVAEFFNEISRESDPLEPFEVPTTYDRPIEYISIDAVCKLLRAQKKPNSMVSGDLFPTHINDIAPVITVPLTEIYNSILSTMVWPIA